MNERYINRELSWLDFNGRVLALASDTSIPLLERVKFLAIFATNLDEFFMVRVAGLGRQVDANVITRSPDGLTPKEQLAAVSVKSKGLTLQHANLFAEDLLPALQAHGVCINRWSDLDDVHRKELDVFFDRQTYPVVTPLAVDPAHPFPYISNLSLNLAVLVRDPHTGLSHFARVKVPPLLPRFVEVSSSKTFVPLEDVIAANLTQLFPGMEVIEHHAFRVTRNADVEVDDDDAEDLLLALEEELRRRRFSPAVRLEVEQDMPSHILDLLIRELQIDRDDVHVLPGPLDLSGLWSIYNLDRPELKDEPFLPATHPALAGVEDTTSDMFSVLKERDVLLHHPYDNFSTSVERFVEQAASDPDVLAIKQTLYRTSGDSSIVTALAQAAQAGKQVVVLVEIKARFDEKANIGWARTLERAGCHVVYGLVGLKTHCKLLLVVRQEGAELRRYAHCGTGNYNSKTAKIYEDLGLLTADPTLGADVSALFNHLTGYSRQKEFRRLIVAPHSLRPRLLQMIHREMALSGSGAPGHIRIKVNSLVDEEIIDALYEASGAGVKIELAVRGICSLRPGVPGLSENIRVVSVVGRFLEHSRIFHFDNGGTPGYFIGSADMMRRNLHRRVEVLVQIDDTESIDKLDEILSLLFDERSCAWELTQTGVWDRKIPEGCRDVHIESMGRVSQRA